MTHITSTVKLEEVINMFKLSFVQFKSKTTDQRGWEEADTSRMKAPPVVTTALPLTGYLYDEGSQEDGAEDEVVEDAFEDVPLAVNLAGIQFVEQLHLNESVEHDGVVRRGWGVEGGVPAALNIKHLLTCQGASKITEQVDRSTQSLLFYIKFQSFIHKE